MTKMSSRRKRWTMNDTYLPWRHESALPPHGVGCSEEGPRATERQKKRDKLRETRRKVRLRTSERKETRVQNIQPMRKNEKYYQIVSPNGNFGFELSK